MSPRVCVAVGIKKKGKRLVGDKFVAPLTNIYYKGLFFLCEEMGFNQKIFKMQLKELIIWGCFVTPCAIDEMQKQVWHLLSSFQQEQVFHAKSYSHFLQLGSLVI